MYVPEIIRFVASCVSVGCGAAQLVVQQLQQHPDVTQHVIDLHHHDDVFQYDVNSWGHRKVDGYRESESGAVQRQADHRCERLHQQDAAATLSDKADELAKLWDNDAVRIQPGHPAEVSKAVIYANDKHWEASKGNQKTLCGHMEIQDLQIAGDWAFEWAYFSYKENTAEGKVSTGQGKVLRVLHRQVDGSWKFARVMNFTEKLPTDAPVSHPCE